MKSIRARLSAFLLLAALFTALVIGATTYRRALQQSERIFDYQLTQIALSLRDQGAAPLSALADGPDERPLDLVVQIWSSDGTVVYQSHPADPLFDRATLGFADIDTATGRWRVYSMPAGARVIQVAQPLELKRGRAVAAALQSLVPLLVFAPLMALLIWWLVGRSLAPLQRLTHQLAERHARSLNEISEPGLPDEIAPLAGALNSLLARLKRAFAGQRAFVADAAHELRSPLTALKLQMQLLERAPDDAARAEALGKLHEGVDRATRLIEQLIAAARTDPNDTTISFQPIDLTELVRQVIAEVFVVAQTRDIGVELEANGPVMLPADAAGLRILTRNLLDNAIRYTPDGGMVRVNVAADVDEARLVIEDSGPGIPPHERQRVFDRFYRLEPTDQTGSGLGLSIVRNVAEQHGARVELDTSGLGGLKVSIVLRIAGLS